MNSRLEIGSALFAFTDISERRQLETQLRQAQKLESVGQLAAGIAHEINTPTQYVGDNLRFLKDAFADLSKAHAKCGTLLDSADGDTLASGQMQDTRDYLKELDLDYLAEEVPRAIDQSIDGTDRIASIVLAMKEFSHPGTEELTACDLNHAIENTITVARNEWKYVAEVETSFDSGLPLVPCLQGEINQVILNMLVNAAQAITEAAGTDEDVKGKITVATRCLDGWAELRISDTGKGIPDEHVDRIFDPFFTTKEVGQGTGQGLASAHNVVVEKHHGSIEVETEVGKGSTFIVRLPLETP